MVLLEAVLLTAPAHTTSTRLHYYAGLGTRRPQW